MNCPHCQGSIDVETVSEAADESRVALSIIPAEGELFDLRTIGGVLTEFSRLVEAAGIQHGTKTIVLLEDVVKEGGGRLAFHAIVCRTGDRKVRL